MFLRSRSALSSSFESTTGARTVIKPIPKAVEAMLHQVFRRPKIEPRINYELSTLKASQRIQAQVLH